MADPIDHDVSSSVVTAGNGALKGGLIGGAIAIGGGALLGAAVLSLIGLPIVGAVLGAVVGFGSAGALATIGGLLGFASGGDKVRREKEAFRDRVRSAGRGQQQQGVAAFNNGEITGVQQGYQIGRMEGEQAGFQKGAQYGAQAVVTQLHQHMDGQAQAMSEASTGGGFADKVASCKCESRVEMVDKKRQAAAAAAAAGTQVG